ncbi:hypothetical protein [Flavobacterium aciduliphilum]|uniref:Uncharacterized protein n=1 Tax=Flavobacterium aciduliphilum TaxID=1101402 RepID=A0A328YIC9_9FLAO|nr:hypothetical protein [Flavobacterium aciduliphilum]RAR73801.1 hypothetical protein CLV55_103120 [Flavobacterium aciduliphilum]
MVSTYSSAVSSVICIDLLNLSPIEFKNLCITSSVVNRFEPYLSVLYKKLHDDVNDEENSHLIYIDNDFLIGSKRHQQSHEKFQLGGFENLQENYTPIIDNSLFAVIEKELYKNKSLKLDADLFDLNHQAILNKENKRLFSFSLVNAFLKVTGPLAISPTTIANRYHTPIYFFDTLENKDTLVLQTIYYKDLLPIVFVFINDDGQEFLGWNERYLVFLDRVKPINERLIDAEDILNSILDKIYLKGLETLKQEELSFLDQYSKL